MGNREAYGFDAENRRKRAEAAEKTDAERALASEKTAIKAGEIAKDTRDGGRERE